MENRITHTTTHETGQTPLLIAAKRGDVDSLKILFEARADTTRKNRKGATALHYAASGGSGPCLKFLIETAGLNIEIQDDAGQTPLHISAMHGNELCVKHLLKAEANHEARNKRNQIPFDLLGDGDAEACRRALRKH